MINGMVKMRVEGFTHAEIARRYRISPRSVRRHTQGVSPRLVHAGDAQQVDLLAWCAGHVYGLKDHLELTVREIDVLMKAARKAVADLDKLTVQRLQVDHKLQVDFFVHVVFPPAAREIRRMRLIDRIEEKFGPLGHGEENPDDGGSIDAPQPHGMP